ncbi:ABC transporter permease [Pseudochelatococcus sp. B33]
MKTVLWGLSFPLALLALWWISSEAGWLPAQILPAPVVIWDSLNELLQDGSLWAHTLASLERVAIGLAFGALFGLIFGAASGLSRTFRAYFYPPVQAVARVNVLAWMPLLALFVGIDEELKYLIIAWSSSIPIILGTARGIENVSPALQELGAAFNFRTLDRLRLIVLPASLPSIFTGLREGLANAWQTLVLVELFASFEGLGYLMVWGRQLFQLELVIVSMIVIGVIGLMLSIALRWIENLGQPWKTEVGDER